MRRDQSTSAAPSALVVSHDLFARADLSWLGLTSAHAGECRRQSGRPRWWNREPDHVAEVPRSRRRRARWRIGPWALATSVRRGLVLLCCAAMARGLGFGVGSCVLVALGCSTAAPDAPVESRQHAVLAAALEDTFNVTQSSVAVSGGTAVIGATQAGPGAVYVRVRSPAGTWSEQQKLVPSDVPSGGRFGYAVAIDGNTLVASAPGVGTNYGAVYVFVRTGTSWALQQKLTHADNYTFGTAVAVSGDRLAIRQNGYIVSDARVHVYERSGTSWTFKNLSVAYNDEALALSGNNLAWTGKVTAPSGSKDVIVNGQSVMVVPDNADISLALDGSTLAVGQIGLSGAPGKLQLFSGPSWSNAGTMTGPNGGFGSSVSLSGPALLTNNNSGEVPLFARVGNVWSSTPAYSFAPPSTSSVSLSGLTAAVRYSSSVAIYRLGGLTGGACGTTGECIEPGHTCVDSVCCTSACTGGCEACSVAAGAVKDGTCVPVGKGTACGAYVCTGASGTCPTSCAADADCAPGKFCSAAGACVDQKLQGAACVPASDCRTLRPARYASPGFPASKASAATVRARAPATVARRRTAQLPTARARCSARVRPPFPRADVTGSCAAEATPAARRAARPAPTASPTTCAPPAAAWAPKPSARRARRQANAPATSVSMARAATRCAMVSARLATEVAAIRRAAVRRWSASRTAPVRNAAARGSAPGSAAGRIRRLAPSPVWEPRVRSRPAAATSSSPRASATASAPARSRTHRTACPTPATARRRRARPRARRTASARREAPATRPPESARPRLRRARTAPP